MPLRNSLISQIHESLNASSFASPDFDVRSDAEVLLTVIFRARPEYKFVVSVSQYSEGKVFAYRTPGSDLDSDEIEVTDLSRLPNLVRQWTDYLRGELRAALPVYDELDALRQKVEEHIRDHIEEANERFSHDEVADLRGKLDELVVKLEQMREQQTLTDQQVQRLEKQVKVMSDNLEGFDRGTWFRTAVSKLWSMGASVASSPEGRKLLTKAAEHAIGMDSATDI